MARLAVLCDDATYVARLRSLNEHLDAQIVEVGSSGGRENQSVTSIMSQRPDAVLLGADMPMSQRISLTEELDATHPEVVIVWVVDEDSESWRLASRSGARDILSPDANDDAVISQLQAATSIADRRRDQAIESPDLLAPTLGRIVSVVSPKGGSGKTMLSANVAVGLAETAPNGVVLVDLDLQFGDISSALGLRPQYSVMDVMRAGGDATTTKAFLTAHSPGLFVLPAPANPAEADDARPETIAKLLTMLRAEFSFVIVDTGAGIDEPTLTAVEQSTDVMFITTIDVAAIQSLRKAVVVYDRLELDQHDRWFVLNRANSRTGLSSAEIEDVTGLAIDAEIPSHRSISKSMNQGAPAIVSERRTKVGKSLVAATKLLTTTKKRRGR